jgi:hypothetical protein
MDTKNINELGVKLWYLYTINSVSEKNHIIRYMEMVNYDFNKDELNLKNDDSLNKNLKFKDSMLRQPSYCTECNYSATAGKTTISYEKLSVDLDFIDFHILAVHGTIKENGKLPFLFKLLN